MAALALYPAVSGAAALLLGIFVVLAFENPVPALSKRLSTLLLQVSIIGLGAGMDLRTVAKVGMEGFGYTAVGISFTLLTGLALTKLLKTEKEVSLLLSVGTAICGGSAIAAVGPVIRAKSESMTVAMATVFVLNAAALLFFPWLGHLMGLDQNQFGLFSALAIHDTSSVVASAMQYGHEALSVAVTVKLARALWIVPVALVIGLIWKSEEKHTWLLPWFILGFVAAAALVTWVPELAPMGEIVAAAAKRSLVLALFFIGSGMTLKNIRQVGPKPFVLGIILWIIVGSCTLAAVKGGYIN